MRDSMNVCVVICVYSVLFWTRTYAADTINTGRTISDGGETLVSSREGFELGFFSPGSSRNRYLGIWYKRISTGTVVWVANREAPLFDTGGVLNITSRGILVLLNSTNQIVWSSNATGTARNPVAQLLETGNLVVKDRDDSNPENYLWQSFDYPCDNGLPGVRVGKNWITGFEWFLSSWKSTDDPAPGDYTVRMDVRGVPQVVVNNGSDILFRPGSWNGLRFTGAPQLRPNPVYEFQFVSNEQEVYYTFELLNNSVVSRMVLSPSGVVRRFTWIDQRSGWVGYYAVQVDQCDNYAYCGPYGNCNMNESPVCSCLEGFVPRSQREWNFLDWSDGCVRRTPLDCDNRDGFSRLTRVKLPDAFNAWIDKSKGLEECRELCSQNCSCTAYANSDIRSGGSGCLLWFGTLIDMREFPEGGQDIYIRLAASELDATETNRNSKRKMRLGIVIGCVITAVVGLLIVGFLSYQHWKRRRSQGMTNDIDFEDRNDGETKDDMELPTFDLVLIAKATNNFSNNLKLGEGGFGSVYKASLADGEEVAVKRLSKDSGQGPQEFKNEVILISRLQHVNLVKLLGCCIQGDEKMLIYEYMPNKSLDVFIFDEKRSKFLHWHNRFHIIGGIARGLLYLHQDSRLRIIHRDLKASNILLDSDMNPKISDFGLAKTFGRDQSVANTKRVVGTYGYMSPEYAVDGLVSVKSDVFSFGVLVLEIISGKRNRGFHHLDHGHNLLGHAWRLWTEKRALELVYESLKESCGLSQVLRCIHVGLLCVQKLPEDRPNMSTVVLMLASEGSLPQPKQPGFYTERNPFEAESSSSKDDMGSVNEITTTLLHPR